MPNEEFVSRDDAPQQSDSRSNRPERRPRKKNNSKRVGCIVRRSLLVLLTLGALLG